jgi:hypothetical protein
LDNSVVFKASCSSAESVRTSDVFSYTAKLVERDLANAFKNLNDVSSKEERKITAKVPETN